MREKELRLALICYGGISLAVYMHGITKETWHLLRASRAFHADDAEGTGSEAIYHRLLASVADRSELRLRVLSDIIAGASAGGINGVFLAQAIDTGQSLDPLTDLWLSQADVDNLLDPDARPLSRFTKFWATPIAWFITGKRGGTVEKTVSVEAREEVRAKLSRFVRARWFAPPFGGEVFTNMLLDAFDAMAKAPVGPVLLPPNQPLDLFVTVTDFHGHEERLRLNSPREIDETEHRLTIGFRGAGGGSVLGDVASLAFASRATAGFPGAFPPFVVDEMDRVLARRQQTWPERWAFLGRLLPRGKAPEELVLIDGSVLANAPFKPAIDALRERPAKREVDRRFVYIDPKPGIRAVKLSRKGTAELPGFFGTIFGAMSDIPREQPIRDNLEAIENRSARIRRMQRIVDAIEPDVEASISTLFGRTFFLDKPTPTRLNAWRQKAQDKSAREAGHAYAAYAHTKLSGIVEELVGLVARLDPALHGDAFEDMRQSLWHEVRERGIDKVTKSAGSGATDATILFFQQHDVRFRIRRLRFLARALAHLIDTGGTQASSVHALQNIVYARLAAYLERESKSYFRPFNTSGAASLLDDIAGQRGLSVLDFDTDTAIADALANLPKAERRTALLAFVGFPYFDISTLPMLQGEGLDEFDPIKVDRIAPDDARSIRSGGAKAMLKGIEFNSFGAFFSRAYRENDYLWGRLHGGERLIDIVCSTLPSLGAHSDAEKASVKRQLFVAILDEEESRLASIPELFATLRHEIATGPLAKELGSS
jgi:patatin-related protein